MKTSKLFKFVFILLIGLQAQAEDSVITKDTASGTTTSGNIFINVGEAKLRKSIIALPPFQSLGSIAISKKDITQGKELYNTIYSDLSLSSFFQFLPQEAIVEDTTKTSLRPKPQDPAGFSFSSWQQLSVEFLIRGGYRIVGERLKFEGYLYYVPKGQILLAKSYESGRTDTRPIAHRFANDVLEKLTGRKGVFNTKITFSRTTRKSEKEVFVADWDAQNPVQISDHKSISISPSWSPNGRYISYTAFALHKKSRQRNADVFRYDLQTRQRTMVSYQPGVNSGVSFLPDTKNFIMRLSKDGNSDLYLMSFDGKVLKRLTNGPQGAMNVEPSVSPDGTKVLFSSDRSGQPMIHVMDIDGSNPKRLTIAGKYNSTPTWSPDGKRIAFVGQDFDKAGRKGYFDIFLMDANGSNMTRLTSATKKDGTGADNENPSFSPDGRSVLFSSNRTGHYQLYITDIDGTNERRLTFDTNDYFSPQWSPYLE